MTSFDPNTYCSLPFVGFDNRVKHVCCWTHIQDRGTVYETFSHAVNSDKIKQLQNDLLNGVKNSLCQDCWNYESLGQISHRQIHLNNKSRNDILQEIQNKKLKHLVIDSGNVCNLACRTCSPESSSSLIKEFKFKSKKFEFDNSKKSIKHTQIDQLKTEDFANIETISVLGGEPFLNLDHLELLQHIIDIDRARHCELNYSINGTVPMSPAIQQIMIKFKTVYLSLSIDSVGPQFEYIRTNGQWEFAYQNLNKLQEISKQYPNIRLTAHPTISVLNVLYLEPLLDWYQQMNWDWSLVFCDFPKEYSFCILNDQQKNMVIDQLKKSKFDLSAIIQKIQQSPFDSKSLELFWKQIEFTKDYKGLNAHEYLPKLIDLLQ